jgi:predicted porin
MKKTLIALAALSAFAGTAQAQSNVTVYGQVDAGLRNQTNVDAAGGSKLGMSSSGTYHSNRFGFKGSEDLGNGLKANFQLEGGFDSGTGIGNNGLFDRTASVGLSGAFGRVDLGRQYTIAYDVNAAYDPMAHKFSGITPVSNGSMGTRNNNAIKYSGTFGAFTARIAYAAGEVPEQGTSNGSTQALGLNYDNGPISLGGAYTQTKDKLGLGNDVDNYTVGGAYTIGPVKLSAGYADEKKTVVGNSDSTGEWAWVGAAYDVSPVLEVSAAYYQVKNERATFNNGKKDLFMLSSVYSMSKRTKLYAEIDHSKVSGDYFSNVSAASDTSSMDMNNNRNQLGVSAGMIHYF